MLNYKIIKVMKNLFFNEENTLEEILFKGRNKEYGAYVLRNEYDRTLTKAMFIGVAFFAAVALTPFLLNSFKTPVAKPAPIGEGHILKQIPIVQEKEPEPVIVKPQKVEVKPLEKTVKLEIPTPTKVLTKKETPATKLSDTKDAKIGLETVSGEVPSEKYTPPAVTGPVEVKGPPVVEVPKTPDNAIKTSVDVSADFIGGINAFRNKVVGNFDTSMMDGTGEVVKTTVVFVVERDGTISDVKATGSNATFNREAEKTIKSVRGKWIPAKLNGENVRSYFKFPISMQFE